MKRQDIIVIVFVVVCACVALGLAKAVHDFAMKTYDAHVELQRLVHRKS